MSRVDDLIALVQSANDAHLVNPNRNARMAYIQIDDICEPVVTSIDTQRGLPPNKRSHLTPLRCASQRR